MSADDSRAADEPDRAQLGAVLRRLRRAAGMSQQAVEAATGIQQSKISAWERGEQTRPYPELPEVLAVERALGLSRGTWLVEAGVVDVPRTETSRAIAYDPLLTPRDRGVVLALYSSVALDSESAGQPRGGVTRS